MGSNFIFHVIKECKFNISTSDHKTIKSRSCIDYYFNTLTVMFFNITDKQSAPLEEDDSGLVRVELDMMFTLTDWVELLFGFIFIFYYYNKCNKKIRPKW